MSEGEGQVQRRVAPEKNMFRFKIVTPWLRGGSSWRPQGDDQKSNSAGSIMLPPLLASVGGKGGFICHRLSYRLGHADSERKGSGLRPRAPTLTRTHSPRLPDERTPLSHSEIVAAPRRELLVFSL